MKNLLLTLLLSLIWAAVQGAFTVGNLFVGFVLGYAVLLVMQPLIGEAGYDARLWYQVMLIGVFLRELVLSSVRVAWEALTPGYGMEAGIICVPLDVQSDLGITLFANLISLTPGTLSLEVAEDRKCLYVHSMYIVEGPAHEAQGMKDTLEYAVVRALGKEVAGLTPDSDWKS